MPSPMEELNRLRIALDIASWLMAAGRHSTEAANANSIGWSITMGTLRVFGADLRCGYVPSPETRAEVVRIMAMFEQRAAICGASHNLAVAAKRAPVESGLVKCPQCGHKVFCQDLNSHERVMCGACATGFSPARLRGKVEGERA